jgi:AcrR family transcriptional regulator
MMGGNEEASGTRIEILMAAIRVMAEKSYSNMSMQDIAEASGFTKPTIYYYFTSKKGLFLALVDHVNGCLEDLLRKELATGDPVSLSLERLAKTLFEIHARDECFARAHLAVHTDTALKALLPSLTGRFTEIDRLLQELISRGVETGEFRQDVSIPVLCRIYSSVLHASLSDLASGVDKTPSAHEIVRILMQGIGS